MSVKEEIKKKIKKDMKKAEEILFKGLVLPEKTKKYFLSSLLSGHHLLIVGPPGSGKTELAFRVVNLLSSINVVKDCPIGCLPEEEGCPWCAEMGKKEVVEKIPSKRLIRIQGSPELVPEDIIGDIDPEAALKYGIHDPRSFIPGKALRANHGILVLDFIDRMPERVMNVVLQALDGDRIATAHLDEQIPLDFLMIATGAPEALDILPSDMIDRFDIVYTEYISNKEDEKEILRSKATLREDISIDNILEPSVEILRRTRGHTEIRRGVSTRGGINYIELLNVYPSLEGRNFIVPDDIKEVASISFPHRIKLHEFVATTKDPEEVIYEIVREVLGEKEKRIKLSLSREDIRSVALEIAKEDKLKRPLKYGFYDILLKRMKRYPESELAKLHKEVYGEIQQLREGREELTQELLEQVEEARKFKERLLEHKKKLEMEALELTLETLEEIGILERDKKGFVIGQRGILFLLEMLFPKAMAGAKIYGYGKHSTGKKTVVGEGRVIGTRKYKLGDRYRDVSYKDTIREAIRNRRDHVERDDIIVTKKDIRTNLYIVLAIDLSGTMSELDKLWYAKETAGALALSSLQYGDSIGIVSFSNLAEDVVDITKNPYLIMKKVLDLDLHENAFTNIGYGIRKAKEMLLRKKKSSASRHIIVISDGDATAPDPSPEKFAIREAIKAARKGITISTVCIHQASSNPELMQRIADIGKGRMYSIEGGELTKTVLEERDRAKMKAF
ncbi:MAG: VWA domain-containing protein [Candidatus Syntropharchaeia archaeon]